MLLTYINLQGDIGLDKGRQAQAIALHDLLKVHGARFVGQRRRGTLCSVLQELTGAFQLHPPYNQLAKLHVGYLV
jgi:hypothetical protein